MKPAAFDYFAAESTEEAVTLLTRFGEDARPLAGGQSLLPLLNMRAIQPKAVVDLGRCRTLDTLREEDGHIVIGAMTRQIAAERSEIVRRGCPLLAAALPHVGGMASRNRGTVCGSLAHADPLAELPSVALALDAELEVLGAKGRRVVAARDFFVSELTTSIATGEMLGAVRFPKAAPGSRSTFLEVGIRRHGFAVVGVAIELDLGPGRVCTRARIAAMGVGATPVRLAAVEKLLAGQAIGAEAIRAAREAASREVEPRSDVHGSAAYRRHVLGALVARGIEALAGDAGGQVQGGRP